MKTHISPALAPSHTVPSPRRRPLASGLSLPLPGGAELIGFAATFGIAPGALAGRQADIGDGDIAEQVDEALDPAAPFTPLQGM